MAAPSSLHGSPKNEAWLIDRPPQTAEELTRFYQGLLRQHEQMTPQERVKGHDDVMNQGHITDIKRYALRGHYTAHTYPHRRIEGDITPGLGEAMVRGFQSSMEKVNEVAVTVLCGPKTEKAYLTFRFKTGPFELYIHAQAEHADEKKIHYSYFESKEKYDDYLRGLHESGFEAKELPAGAI